MAANRFPSPGRVFESDNSEVRKRQTFFRDFRVQPKMLVSSYYALPRKEKKANNVEIREAVDCNVKRSATPEFNDFKMNPHAKKFVSYLQFCCNVLLQCAFVAHTEQMEKSKITKKGHMLMLRTNIRP